MQGYYSDFSVFNKRNTSAHQTVNAKNSSTISNNKAFALSMESASVIAAYNENKPIRNIRNTIHNISESQLTAERRNIKPNIDRKNDIYELKKNNYFSQDTLVPKNDYVRPKQKKTEPLGVISFILGVSSAILLLATWSVMTLVIAMIILLVGGGGYMLAFISGHRINKNKELYKGKLWPTIGGIIGGFALGMAVAIILLWNFSII